MIRGFRTSVSLIIFFGLVSFECYHSGSQTTVSADVALLAGEWVVDSQTVSPVAIGQRCKPVQKGTTFKFVKNVLELYIDAAGKACDVYHYKIYHNTISFIKEDMIWLCTYELNQNQLKLKSNNFFTLDESNKSVPLNKQPATTQNVVVTLFKKNN